jgi:hypothetical protein
MSRVAYLLSFDRVIEDGAHGADVKCDPDGGNIVTAPHFADPGDDSAPLPGDYVALDESSGSGGEHATGYADVRNAGKAGPGEKRLYARKADGAPIAELWLKADGSVVISNAVGTFEMSPNGDFDIKGGTIALNGVTIGKDGTIETAGDMVVKGLSFSQHVHLSAAPGSATGPATAIPKPPGP